jgi:LacI family transcriptional regulator
MPKPSQDNAYWTLPIRGINKAQEELASQKIEVRYFFYDKYSKKSFHQTSRDVLKGGLGGLIIAPALSGAFDEFVKTIPKSLPYVFFDSFIPNSKYIAYIGEDSFQSGFLSGKLMCLLIKERGTIAVLKVLPSDYHINDRVSGFVDYCTKCAPCIPRIYELDWNGTQSKRKKVFERIFIENKNLKGIFISNTLTHQVAEFVKNNPGKEKVHIIGYDLIEENIKYLKEGVIDFLISQQSEKQGYEALYTLYRHVFFKESVEKNIMMQIDIVTNENIDYYKS